MDTLAIELRLSILQNEMTEIANGLSGKQAEIVRYSARILGLLTTTGPEGDEIANDHGGLRPLRGPRLLPLARGGLPRTNVRRLEDDDDLLPESGGDPLQGGERDVLPSLDAADVLNRNIE